jgi:hypothetical protein
MNFLTLSCSHNNLTLRSARRVRLEGWATGAVSVAHPSRRRFAPPQDEVAGLSGGGK